MSNVGFFSLAVVRVLWQAGFCGCELQKNEDDTGTEGRMLMILQLQLSSGQRLEVSRWTFFAGESHG